MKARLGILIVITMLFLLLLAGPAWAQSVSFCASLNLSTTSAPAGSTVNLSGIAEVPGDSVTIAWDGPPIASAVSDQYGSFSFSFTVPSDAAVGAHKLTIWEGPSKDIMCPDTTFTVLTAVHTQPPKNVQTTSTTPAAPVDPGNGKLPATGFFLIPAGALIAGGLGMTFIRKRRR